jgi:glycosyltransferase involved in cell wall biosynthesis
MKILMLNYEFPPIGGGAGKANLCLLKEYAGRDDLRVDFLTSKPEPGFTVEKFSDNVTIYKVGVHKKDLHYWRKFEVLEWLFKAEGHYRRLVRENDYDLAHAFFGFPTGWLCYLHRRKLGYIISLRGSDVPGKNARLAMDYKILGPLFKSIWKGAQGVVACSDGLKKRALDFYDDVSIDVIPNGVDLQRFMRREPRSLADMITLITVGRLSSTKRVDMLVDAVDMILQRGRKVRLIVAGGGSGLVELERIVAEKSLGSSVEIMGRVESDQMAEVYGRSDIYVSASMQEGMSNAMLEAMASGLPIVTTSCEGVEELIGDNGIVVGDSAGDIASAVMGLAGDGERFTKMCAAARVRAEKFSWPDAAKRYIECYRDLIGGGDVR